MDLPAKSFKQFWINIHVPDDAKAGTYNGTVIFTTKTESLSLPLRVTVHPFDLKTDLPTVSVEAAYSKHRKQDIQPISRQLADMLRPFLVHKNPEEPVFSPHSGKTADMLRVDLRAADIDPVDSAGNRIDFHALRHTFITLGAQAGIAPLHRFD